MPLFQPIKRRQRRKQRDNQAVHEQDHERQTSARDIVRVFSDYIRRKYGPIQVDEECIRKTLQAGYGHLSDDCRATLEVPITAEELRAAVFKGGSKKYPGKNGIGLAFFKVFWEDSKLHENAIYADVQGP